MDIRLSPRGKERMRVPEPSEAFREESKRIAVNAKRNRQRRERDAVLKDLGLTKVRGAVSGRTYWE